MCGIAGVVGYRDSGRAQSAELDALNTALVHRGPDDSGTWLSPDECVGFAHRRLSIIDLSAAGRQPMTDASGRFTIVYNGEIYNYRALRDELAASGHSFRTATDTEVILEGYRAWGRAVLDRLRGMFAFALYDAHERHTLLARDPLGIKPLYTLDDGKRLLFASEIQALRAICDGGDVDPEGLASYLQWGSIPAPRTLYARIRALPAGSYSLVGDERVAPPQTYFRLEDCFGHSEAMDDVEAEARIRAALVDSARAHRVADVPVGAFLSGGVDSSVLVSLLSEAGEASLRTVTLAFDDPKLDESDLARRAAELYGTEHLEVPANIDDVRDRMPDAIRALDQPSIDGVNTYFVSEAAAQSGLKVAVSGVGGDELFGGYGSFSRHPRIRRIHSRLTRCPGIGPALPRAACALLDLAPRSSTASRLSQAFRYGGSAAGAYVVERGILSPAEVRGLMAPAVADAVSTVDPARDLEARLRIDDLPEAEHVSALELRQYLQCQLLRDTDAVSMRHSLEVRTPLVDRELLEAVARVPAPLRLAGPAKQKLRAAARPPIPEALWNRKKQGFGLPFDHWLRSGGIPIDLPDHPWLRGDAMRDMRRGFERGRIHYSRIWLLIVLGRFLS